ncbi:MAG: SIS domain-containing protein [Candidatus Peregrinibacteria bacterium]|nr:SIS domain-containing protein [Candidatus Peregrinibacteria bacterium]MCB9807989.1 SIS domain-containing protein [Candidatus Peribacteria bacterium]
MNDKRLNTVKEHLMHSRETFERVELENTTDILVATDLLVTSFKNGGKLLICGNGGSAADAQHVAAELMSRLHRDHDRPAIPAIALTTDTSFLTAYSNDMHFEGIFARQVEGIGNSGDVLLGISTSGSSTNVIEACKVAKKKGMRVIGLTGRTGLHTDADCIIAVSGDDTQCTQEAHLAIEHMLCELVERSLYPTS